MKQTLRSKYLMPALVTISILSFLFVNFHASFSNTGMAREAFLVQDTQVEQSEKERDSHFSDLAVVIRLIEFAQRFVPGN